MIHEVSPFTLCRCGVVHREALADRDRTAWRREFTDWWMTDALKNVGLTAMTGVMAFFSVHSAFSLTGANELASASYSRSAPTWASPSAGAINVTGTRAAFNLTAGDDANWVGAWSASSGGTFYGMQVSGAESLLPCSVEAADLSANNINSQAHGYAVDDRVVFWNASDLALPSPLVVGTIYWVTAVTTNTFTVSTSQGGTAVDITTSQAFFSQRGHPQHIANDSAFRVTSFSFDMAGLL